MSRPRFEVWLNRFTGAWRYTPFNSCRVTANLGAPLIEDCILALKVLNRAKTMLDVGMFGCDPQRYFFATTTDQYRNPA